MTNFVVISILKNNDSNLSPDCNDILFGCGVERSGTRNQKDTMESGK
ncbi:hypothetical protein AB4Y90_13945 [Chryseobacterium sp. 2TAF14]